jgi:hypothetical protein
MTDTQSLKDDLAFLRDLTQDSGRGLARSGFALAAIGFAAGAYALLYWAAAFVPLGVRQWTMWGGLAIIPACFILVQLSQRWLPPATGAAARAVAAAWRSVGASLAAGSLGLFIASVPADDSKFVLAIFPVLMFCLYGAAWSVAYAAKRQTWFAWVSGGCLACAFTVGLLYKSPHQWLVMAIGLFLLVGLPGLVIFKKAQAQESKA